MTEAVSTAVIVILTFIFFALLGIGSELEGIRTAIKETRKWPSY